MPYICTDNNRYIGEHSCNVYHYGDMTLVRDCCVNDALKYKQMTIENALTTSHPAYKMFTASWNSLTDAEMKIVGDIVYLGNSNGFKAV
jgi:hypothetical protein